MYFIWGADEARLSRGSGREPKGSVPQLNEGCAWAKGSRKEQEEGRHSERRVYDGVVAAPRRRDSALALTGMVPPGPQRERAAKGACGE